MTMNWLQRLQDRWKVNAFQVVMILLVFACTGFSVLFIKRPLFAWWFADGNVPVWMMVAYWVLILPVYNMFLLCYGFVFGQFHFFWNFEKRFFNRILSIFKKQKD
jgi:hypothetical protein